MSSQCPSCTDSPWFWVLIFSGMALGALVSIGPKYGGRQARLERQYQARERIATERIAQNDGGGIGKIDERSARRDFASPDATLVPLWPLAVVLSVVMIVSLVMLLRGAGCFGSSGGKWRLWAGDGASRP